MSEYPTAAEAREQALEAMHERIGDCYAGAFSMAWIHGWRFTGEVTEADWPKMLDVAVERAIERAQEAAVREALSKLTYEHENTIPGKNGDYVVVARVYIDERRREAEARLDALAEEVK